MVRDGVASNGVAGVEGAATEAQLPLPTRLARFLRERFPPAVHGPAIAIFFVTNAAIAQAATTGADAGVVFTPGSLLALAAVGLMFIRLRLFDEVKDYEHDKVANPGRPLPRGLVTPGEVNAWAALAAALEGALAAALGRGALFGWLAVLAFTLLMRFEFFVRDAIRPRLFTYALIHTPSGGLVGLFVFCAATGRPPWEAPRAVWLYAAAGWTLLMVFELGRKTCDPRTQPDPDTYSTVFGGRGAALLNGAFVFASTLLIQLAVLDALRAEARAFGLLLWGVTAIVISIIAAYGLAPSARAAAKLRLAVQGYLLLASLLPAGQVLIARGAGFSAG